MPFVPVHHGLSSDHCIYETDACSIGVMMTGMAFCCVSSETVFVKCNKNESINTPNLCINIAVHEYFNIGIKEGVV